MNNPILIPTPVRYRKRRGRSRRKPPLPGLPLELVAAVYDSGTLVDLTFDRAIDVSGFIPGAFFVFDGPGGTLYIGDGPPTVMSPTRILVPLMEVEPTSGAQVLLTIYTENGIVAVDDGGTYPGVAALTLPYP